MPFTIKDMIYGGVAPIIVACMLLLTLRRLLPRDLGERYSVSMATLAGFLVGYGLLSLAPWSPTAHWHWLPYALMAAAVVGAVVRAEGVRFFERLLMYLFVAIAAGWFLVPTWKDLVPSQTVHLILFVVYLVALVSLLEPLAERSTGPLLPLVLWITITAAAVVLALSGSLRFAQVALAGAGALFGVMLVTCFKRETGRETGRVTGAAFVFSMMAVGSLLIGCVHSFSEVPLASYLLVPAAPLALWSCEIGPLSRLTGVKRYFVAFSLPVTLLGSAVLLAVVAEMNSLE
ncbi:MAG: hypothetical protein MI923_26020 [Phycisphaerales bacterium]|nr:hypothetical protein [Phycisphaerales bacterium]